MYGRLNAMWWGCFHGGQAELKSTQDQAARNLQQATARSQELQAQLIDAQKMLAKTRVRRVGCRHRAPGLCACI